jgi:predicted site-specific integrase-resolvase
LQKLLTLKDLIPVLNVSEATIRRWLAAGNFIKPVNGYKCKLLFRPEDLEIWLATGCQQQPVPNIESSSERKKRHDLPMPPRRKSGRPRNK